MASTELTITFVMPGYTNEPIGGYKIVFEHANRLCEKGHKVNILLCRRRTPRSGKYARVLDAIWKVRTRIRSPRLISWFDFHPNVRLLLVPNLEPDQFPTADVVFATMFNTVAYVEKARPDCGKKAFFVQSYEDWADEPESLSDAWSSSIPRVCIANWLVMKSLELSPDVPSFLVPNAIDHDRFGLTQPLTSRRNTVVMLYHTHPNKRSCDGIEALHMVRAKHPQLKAIFFGTTRRPADLPDWVRYYCQPSPSLLLEIYNAATIFLHTSEVEGWPLPPAEAMACGACIVATNNQGVMEYVVDGQNGFLFPIRDTDGMADALLHLLTNDEDRYTLANNAVQDIHLYNWENSSRAMIQAIMAISQSS